MNKTGRCSSTTRTGSATARAADPDRRRQPRRRGHFIGVPAYDPDHDSSWSTSTTNFATARTSGAGGLQRGAGLQLSFVWQHALPGKRPRRCSTRASRRRWRTGWCTWSARRTPALRARRGEGDGAVEQRQQPHGRHLRRRDGRRTASCWRSTTPASSTPSRRRRAPTSSRAAGRNPAARGRARRWLGIGGRRMKALRGPATATCTAVRVRVASTVHATLSVSPRWTASSPSTGRPAGPSGPGSPRAPRRAATTRVSCRPSPTASRSSTGIDGRLHAFGP